MKDNLVPITRKYSLFEIDEMRNALSKLISCRGQKPMTGGGIFFSHNPTKEEVESQLRTLMLASIGIEEIEEQLKKENLRIYGNEEGLWFRKK